MGIKPHIEEINTKLSPPDIFELFKDKPYSFFLDSAFNIHNLGWLDKGLGTYSLIGFEPFLIFKSKNKKVSILNNGKISNFSDSPFKVFKKLFNEYRISYDSPVFSCGAIGYFGYDLKQFIENLPSKTTDDTNLSDCYFGFYDPMVIHDNLKNKTYLCSIGINKEAKRIMKEIRTKCKTAKLDCQAPTYIRVHNENSSNFLSNFTKSDYINAVDKAKDYIVAGDIFQVNLSQRFQTTYNGDKYILYKKLRKVSPAPFAAYLSFDNMNIISSSPERFLKLTDRTVETRPMKGTRPRGKTVSEDARFETELLNSEKDKAELVMIIDLLRNDIGKVCDYNSVKVKYMRTLEKHPTVFQTTATVVGKLVNNKDSIDLLKACFPGGSITGCPKVRSMEIIDELEPTKRAVYTGTLGFLSFNGDIDLSIVIRTLVITGENKVFFQVGGGIVVDSDPRLEYEETLTKAKSLITALLS